MSDIPKNLKFAKTHEWVAKNDDGTLTIGISDHAQSLLGDLVFVELPEVDSEFDAGADAAVVESVKAASDVYCPVKGKVIEVNDQLTTTPELVNSEPYGDGWLFKIEAADAAELDGLLDANAYQEVVESEEH